MVIWLISVYSSRMETLWRRELIGFPFTSVVPSSVWHVVDAC